MDLQLPGKTLDGSSLPMQLNHLIVERQAPLS
jgi:hypothetical protein